MNGLSDSSRNVYRRCEPQTPWVEGYGANPTGSRSQVEEGQEANANSHRGYLNARMT